MTLPPIRPLTAAQRDILILLASGLSYKAIARLRGCAKRTIRTHVCDILCKLGLPNRLAAARYAWRGGLVSVDAAWSTLERHGKL